MAAANLHHPNIVGVCLLWTVQSLRSAVEADDPRWLRAARANLAAWSREYPSLRAVFSHARPIIAVAVSPNGKYVATDSEDETARLWDLTTSAPVGQPLEHPGDAASIAISPDGKTALTGCNDQFARVWDLESGSVSGDLIEHRGEVSVVAISPGGKILLTGGQDRIARLWDAITRKPLVQPLRHNGEVDAGSFSPSPLPARIEPAPLFPQGLEQHERDGRASPTNALYISRSMEYHRK
jgi:eukaryotic-like serine/threonine-protein kinase